MKLRNGNNQKNENTIQVGIMGIDVASEGPLSKKHKASYIFNYRYSTTGLLNLEGGTMDYQDLNLKLNFPTRKAGTFSVWGTSLIDKFTSDFEKNTEKWIIGATAVNQETSNIWQPEVSAIVISLIMTHH